MLFTLVTPRQNAVYELWLIHVGIGPSLVLIFFFLFHFKGRPWSRGLDGATSKQKSGN